MSNCYSSQAEYEDHDFKDGICKDCGTTDRPGVQEMAKSLEASRAEVERLLALNHRLANQIAGYGDRMQETIGSIIRNAKAEALREAANDFEDNVGIGEFAEQSRRGIRHGWAHIDEAWESQGPYMDWLRNRADSLEKP